MRVRTDDDVYRVDAVWLGPPKVTFPWRARYVAWGIGLTTFFVLLYIVRQVGIGFGFFTVAWTLVGTVVLTRVIARMIGYERPLGATISMFSAEMIGPRAKTKGQGAAATPAHLRVRAERPRPQPGRGPRRAERGPQDFHTRPPAGTAQLSPRPQAQQSTQHFYREETGRG
jgi:hypothetical protein